ncbi:MAG: DUF6475 domain-containing protein [Aeromonadaceae bacterium]
MQEQDKPAFERAMMAAGEVYGKEITGPLLQIYFAALSMMTIEQARTAMMAHMQNTDTGQFFPKPADLIKQIAGTTKQQEAAIEDRAAMAWACIERDIRRIGSYGTLKLDDKQALAAVKALGGWQSLCQTESAKMEWKRKEFIRMYETFERTPLEALPASLPGRIELNEKKAESGKGLESLAIGVNKWRESNAQKK